MRQRRRGRLRPARRVSDAAAAHIRRPHAEGADVDFGEALRVDAHAVAVEPLLAGLAGGC